MTILITGIAGFIGSRLSQWIKNHHPEVHVLGLDNFSGGFKENIPDEVRWIECDITDSKKLSEVFNTFSNGEKIDYVYHCAAYASEGRSNHIRSFIHQNNTVGTANVINECIKHTAHLIFFSSVAVYSGDAPFGETTLPNPIDEYGLSKYMSEQSIKIAGMHQGLRWTIVRPRNVYGPGQNLFDPSRNLFGIMCYKALTKQPIIIFGDGSNTRDFTYIDDILEPLWNCKRYHGEIFNLGSSVRLSVRSVVEAFVLVSNHTDYKYTEPRHEVRHAYCYAWKSEDMLHYRSKTSIELGIRQMWEWAKTQKMMPLMEPPRLEVSINAHPSLL